MEPTRSYSSSGQVVDPLAGIGIQRPFKASWIDHINDWVINLPISAWVFFFGLGIILFALQVLFLWLEGGLRDSDLLRVIAFNGFFSPFLLALIYLLDLQARVALDAMRPVLALDESDLERYQYEISHMPARLVLITGFSMATFAILLERLWIAPASYTELGQMPIFTLVFQVIDKSSAFLFGVFIYHTIRQLRLVNFINVNYVRISLSHFRPLQAFSKLTATTAVGLLAGVYGWMIINPDLLGDPVIIGFALAITALAVTVFALPLSSIHNRMKLEKEKMLDVLDLNFGKLFSQLNQSLYHEEHAAVERLNGTITSLEIQYKRIKALPTWPWNAETAKFVFSAIGLPLILAIIQFLVEQTIRM